MSTRSFVFIGVIFVIVGIFGLSALLAMQHQYDVMMQVLGGVGFGLLVLAILGPVAYSMLRD